MCVQSLVEISGRTATGEEKQWCFLFDVMCYGTSDAKKLLACMFVCLSRWVSRKEVRTFNNV